MAQGFAEYRFDNLARVRDLGAPVLIIHGEHDRLVPVALGRALYSAAREPKRALWVPEGGHNDLDTYGATATARQFIGAATGR